MTGGEALLERDAELDRLRGAIAAARDGAGGLVLIEGPAGIGKTALLVAARAIAEDTGMLALVARGRELEREFAFGVARQLFEGPIARAGPRRRTALLAGAAGLARPLLEPEELAQAAPVADRSFSFVHGLYWLTANLAENTPLLVALDDAQHADAPSLQFIAYLAARCSELGVVVALTVRGGEPATDEGVLAAMRSEPELLVLRPHALTSGAVAELVRAGLSANADDAFCAACARASAGNPFLLGELLSELDAERVRPSRDNVAHVDLVSPATVERAVLARLVRLGSAATALARAVAVLEQASLSQAIALAGIDTGHGRRAADELVAAQILTPEPIGFVHPLLRRVVYEQIPPAQLASEHHQAALLLAAGGASPTAVGPHLLRSAPAGEPEAVWLLRRAARAAVNRGDPRSAALLLRRALAEPPGAEQRRVVLQELGEAEAIDHDPAAVEHLREALDLAIDPVARVRAACALGELLIWTGGDAVGAHAMLTRTLAQLGDGAPAQLRVPLETIRAATASVDARLVATLEPQLDSLRALADEAGPEGRALKVFEACWEAQRGPYDGVWRELLDEGLDGGRFVADRTGGTPIVVYAAMVLIMADEVRRAELLLAEVRADARSRGSIGSHLIDLAWGAFLALRRGDLETAAIDAGNALELAQRLQVMWIAIWMMACLTDALRYLGRFDQAAETIAKAPIERVLGTSAALHALIARGSIRLARGDRAGAIEDLRRAEESVIVNNPSFAPWRSRLAVALAPDDPEQALALARVELERAQELGQPRGIGVALRTCGIITGGAAGIPLLEQAVEALRDSPARLELADAMCELGSAWRRSGRRADSREPLREALVIAEGCGAELLAQRARQELEATGARLRRRSVSGPESLTPSERRVAELAASGYANREIAQALFITTKTVGTHLAHIYQKLGLQGQRARDLLGERMRSADERVTTA